MDDAELHRLRMQMGESIQAWGDRPGGRAKISDGYWVVLSGAPSPDANVAMVQDDNPSSLSAVLTVIREVGVPAMVQLAGSANSDSLPGEWQAVGSMPFMSVVLAETEVRADPRVRQASAADKDVVIELLADAFGMDVGIAQVVVSPALTGSPSDLRFWLLDEDGTAVSTVMTAPLDEIVSVWCMATPERFGRRGYGRAILAHVLHKAMQDGARVGLLGATPAGKPLYDATGWHTIEDWQLFVNATSVQFSH